LIGDLTQVEQSLQYDKAEGIGVLHSLQFPSNPLFGDILLLYEFAQDLEQK
jgi:hypothetical protein